MKQFSSRYLKSTTTFIMALFMLLFAATKANAQWIELGGTGGSPFHTITSSSNYISSITTDAAGNVYAGGTSIDASGNYYVAKWNGTAWSELGGTNGSPFNGSILSIATDAGGNVYAGGTFILTSGNYYLANYVAKWNGTAWSELGGANGSIFNGNIHSIATDASGNVYAAGQFTDANGNRYVAKWNGTAWSELGGTSGSPFTINGISINSIATDAGGNVYAVGGFTDANGNYYVAKWNGTSWSVLGGANGSFNTAFRSIATDAGGNVYAVGPSDANSNYYVAKWNGTAWSELGGANNSPFPNINSYMPIVSIATDAGGNVYAGGSFTNANGYYVLAKWNGTSWSELGGTNSTFFNDIITTIATDAGGNVYAGGYFRDANGNLFVGKYAQGNASILPAHPHTVTANYEFTDTAGWTNYYAGDTLLLSLNTHGQNIGTLGDGTFAVKLAATAGAGSNTGIQLTNPLITNASGYWVMNRYWQVSATTEPTAPMGVRFYYNNQDLDDVNGSYPSHNLTNLQLIFYKENGGNPDPTTNLAGATSLISILPSADASDTTWTYHQLTDSTQYAEFSVAGFSGGGGGGTGNDQALPIKIVSFTATKENKEVAINWQTANEINTSYFNIQRSTDGRSFTNIGMVAAKGSSKVQNNYAYTDDVSQLNTGRLYYRLQIADNDGKFSYSTVKAIDISRNSISLSIYPNPVQNNLSLHFNSDEAKAIQVQIVSNEGKVIATQQLQVTAGASTQNINTASLSNGEYYIRLISEEGQTKLKFVKQR